jgi:carbonic anhydrase
LKLVRIVAIAITIIGGVAVFGGAEKLRGLKQYKKFELLCEPKVKQQAVKFCNTIKVQKAWTKGAALSVHGWIYNIENGILKGLYSCITSSGQPKKSKKEVTCSSK